MKFYKAFPYPYLYLIMQQTKKNDFDFFKVNSFYWQAFYLFSHSPILLTFPHFRNLTIYCFDRTMHTKMFFLDKKVWELSRAIKHSVFKKSFFKEDDRRIYYLVPQKREIKERDWNVTCCIILISYCFQHCSVILLMYLLSHTKPCTYSIYTAP